jgi:hypothetical protein
MFIVYSCLSLGKIVIGFIFNKPFCDMAVICHLSPVVYNFILIWSPTVSFPLIFGFSILIILKGVGFLGVLLSCFCSCFISIFSKTPVEYVNLLGRWLSINTTGS